MNILKTKTLNFPSGRMTCEEAEEQKRMSEFFAMTQIERKSLARKKKRSKEWKVAAVGLIILLGLLAVLANHFLPFEKAEAMEIVAPSSFCVQAERDLETWAREPSTELKEYCDL